jgi:PBP1b-binding outer membrane lipoprotein LpoB
MKIASSAVASALFLLACTSPDPVYAENDSDLSQNSTTLQQSTWTRLSKYRFKLADVPIRLTIERVRTRLMDSITGNSGHHILLPAF